jgi:hypothetical protein
VQIAPETCRAYNVVKNSKEYKVHLDGIASNIYITKIYGTINNKFGKCWYIFRLFCGCVVEISVVINLKGVGRA